MEEKGRNDIILSQDTVKQEELPLCASKLSD